MMEQYTTGTGQKLWVHERNESCDAGCCVHNPSDSVLKDCPTHWRYDRGLMERICSHGVGHPDPDHMKFFESKCGKRAAYYEAVHGCDGCCI